MGQGDSRLVFRKHVLRLQEERRISADSGEEQFWDGFWTLPGSAGEVFSLASGNDIRRIRSSAPENLHTLLHQVAR